MNYRENYLRALEFRHPAWIPCSVNFAPRVWNHYRSDLESIVLEHPRLFPEYPASDHDFYDEMPPVYAQGVLYRDNWGCTWRNEINGLEGQVIGHPLADWSALPAYRLPDPLTDQERERAPRDWNQIQRDLEDRRRRGWVVGGNGERLFDRLYFLRGWENLMLDFALQPPELQQLIDLLTGYELRLIEKFLPLRLDQMGFHTDIGMQNGLMISPKSFRQYIKPMFMRLFQTCRQAGVHVLLSSDGRLLDIVDDLVECGVSVHDPQLRANTLPGIIQAYKGKLCAMVDLDRQGFPYMTPQEIRDQVRAVVDGMGDPAGGLAMVAAVYGTDVSLANITALVEAVETECFGNAWPD